MKKLFLSDIKKFGQEKSGDSVIMPSEVKNNNNDSGKRKFSIFGTLPAVSSGMNSAKKKANIQAKRSELKGMKKYYKSTQQQYAALTKANVELAAAETLFAGFFTGLLDVVDKEEPKNADLRNSAKLLADQLKKISTMRNSLNDSCEKCFNEKTKNLHDDYNSRQRDKKTYEAELDYLIARRNYDLVESCQQVADAYAFYFETGLNLMREFQEKAKLELDRLKKAEKPSRQEFLKRFVQNQENDMAAILAQNMPQSPSPDSKIFAVSLKEVLKRSGEPGPIPLVIDKLCKYMEANGTTHEGVFRISGQFSDVNKLKGDIDMGIDVDPSAYSIHTICGAIKSYVRELPDPLLTQELFEQWTSMAKMLPGDAQFAKLKELVAKLPRENYFLLGRIMQMFKLMTEHEATKMNAQNLSIAFGMNLLAVKEDNPAKLYQISASVNKSCELLIIHSAALFPEKIAVVPKSESAALANNSGAMLGAVEDNTDEDGSEDLHSDHGDAISNNVNPQQQQQQQANVPNLQLQGVQHSAANSAAPVSPIDPHARPSAMSAQAMANRTFSFSGAQMNDKLVDLQAKIQEQTALVNQMKSAGNEGDQQHSEALSAEIIKLSNLERELRELALTPSTPRSNSGSLPPPQQSPVANHQQQQQQGASSSSSGQQKNVIQAKRASLNGWLEILDAARNRFYYFNPETKQTSWYHPRDQANK